MEKHFTLDKNLPGPDHWFSADPEELNNLIKEVRRLEANMGTGAILMSRSEEIMAKLCHRSIVASKEINKGNIITTDEITFKRPGTGIMPYDVDKVLGMKTKRNITANSIVELKDLEENFE